ncbi:hypothetical protein E4634_13275 [Mangrovimicrobium sediminis]|uniref:Uncharacterized protein n=1 Tax=Mangrovimicrobium sediminis TaxID=2562682 RepID=A0A4Z0LZF4_9GAMM|nr:hypothetical protein [Haliea sp. SAOS-164]TGD72498.1 hypothetical protein E4634_13275 [Haliea sp. SAOS-164]
MSMFSSLYRARMIAVVGRVMARGSRLPAAMAGRFDNLSRVLFVLSASLSLAARTVMQLAFLKIISKSFLHFCAFCAVRF